MKPLRRCSAPLVLVCITLIGVLAWISACNGDRGGASPLIDPNREAERNRMVNEDIIAHGVKDPAVLAAMKRVSRHRFVPAMYSGFAYLDSPLPIGHDQSISQPSLVTIMTEVLTLKKTDKVLEVGTGPATKVGPRRHPSTPLS